MWHLESAQQIQSAHTIFMLTLKLSSGEERNLTKDFSRSSLPEMTNSVTEVGFLLRSTIFEGDFRCDGLKHQMDKQSWSKVLPIEGIVNLNNHYNN